MRSVDRTYQESQLKLERGDLSGASAAAGAGLRLFPNTNTEWHWRFAVVQGEVLVRQGLSKQSLEVLSPDLPKILETSDMAVRRNVWRAAAEGFLGQFDQADRLLGESESLASEHQPQLLGEVELQKGTLALLRADTMAAEFAYRSALQISRERNDRFLEAAALGNLGLTATKQERYDESIGWNRAALRLSESVGAQDSVASILGNMGWSYFKMGDYENASSLFQQAKEASLRAGLARDQIEWEINLGNVRYEQGDFGFAEAAYQEALAHARSLDDQPAMAECLENLADTNFETGQLDAAQYYRDQVLRILQAHPDHSLELDSSLIAGRIEEARHHFHHAEQLFQTMTRDVGASTALRWEAEARLGETYAAEGWQRGAEREFRQSLETIEQARASVKSEEFRLSFLSSATSFYDDYIDFLVSQNRYEDALEVAALGRSQTLAEGWETTPRATAFSWGSLHLQRSAGRMNSTYLFYWLGQQHSYLWAITPQKTFFFNLPPAVEIDGAVKSYQKALVGPRDVLDTENALGTELYRWLVAPAQDLIHKGSRVVVVPDGSLYGLNFETLLVSSPRLHYWIDDVVIVVANSLTSPGGNSVRKKRPQQLLLMGDPVSPEKDFPDLPQAASEMRGIENHFQPEQQTIYSRGEATAQAYLDSRPDRFTLIHFVAHGTASFRSPLDSAVILTRLGDSYKLYARDIIKQPIDADLVTISACNGEGVRTYFAEGLVGLAWAFLRAGSHSVIAALWEVNDNSTPMLMDQLYAEISQGVSPDVALRDAKLALLNSRTIYRRPFYWAPFQIYESLHGYRTVPTTR